MSDEPNGGLTLEDLRKAKELLDANNVEPPLYCPGCRRAAGYLMMDFWAHVKVCTKIPNTRTDSEVKE